MKGRILSIIVLSVLWTPTQAQRFWSVGAQQADGWTGTDWFGWVYQPRPEPDWVFHAEHGWIFSTSTDPSNIYWWCDNTGWCWSSQSHYPWLYRLANGHWLFYLKSSNVWYFDPALKSWMERPAKQIENPMILVEGGAFTIGARPTQVSSIYIGKYEITWTEWLRVRAWADANGYDIGSKGKGCEGDHPVRNLSWYDAVKWCNARSEMEGLPPVYYTDATHTNVYRSGIIKLINSDVDWNANGYRLPTEAEWQHAAEGGNQSHGYLYSGSDNLDEVGWHSLNSGGASCDLTNSQTGHGTWPVGQKSPNELGLHDMSGNVQEFCWDWHGNIFSIELTIDPRGPDSGRLINRIARGGGWPHGEYDCQTGARGQAVPSGYGEFIGFRVARNSLE